MTAPDPREQLKAYGEQYRSVEFETDACYHRARAQIETIAPAVFNALEKVLELHKPRWFDKWIRTTENAADTVQWQCPVDRESGTGPGYCRTVQAASRALQGEA